MKKPVLQDVVGDCLAYNLVNDNMVPKPCGGSTELHSLCYTEVVGTVNCTADTTVLKDAEIIQHLGAEFLDQSREDCAKKCHG